MKKNLLITYKDKTYWLAVLGVGIALYILSFIIIRSIQQNTLAQYLQAQIPIALVLQEKLSDAQIFDFQKSLESKNTIQKNSVVYISKNAAWNEMNEALYGPKENWTAAQLEEINLTSQHLDNPLPNLIEFKLEPEALENWSSILEELQNNALVADVWYESTLVGQKKITENHTPFSNMLNLIRQNNFWLLGFAIGIALTAALLFRNTLRWHLLVNKPLIQNLALAGAPFTFIQSTYISMAWKVSAFMVAILWVLMLLTVYFLTPSIDMRILGDISFHYVLLALVMAIFAILIYVGVTYRSLAKVVYK